MLASLLLPCTLTLARSSNCLSTRRSYPNHFGIGFTTRRFCALRALPTSRCVTCTSRCSTKVANMVLGPSLMLFPLTLLRVSPLLSSKMCYATSLGLVLLVVVRDIFTHMHVASIGISPWSCTTVRLRLASLRWLIRLFICLTAPCMVVLMKLRTRVRPPSWQWSRHVNLAIRGDGRSLLSLKEMVMVGP